MSAGGPTRPSLAVLSSVHHARTCHAGHSGRTGTPSSWVSSCQFINLRSGSVSAQVIAGKAGGGWCWFCAHANFLQSLSSTLPTLASGWRPKNHHCDHLLSRSHTGQSNSEPTFLQQKGGSGGGESQSPCPRYETLPRNFGGKWTGHFTPPSG